MERIPPSDAPDPQDDDLMSIAAKMFAKYDYFTIISFELGEQVMDVQEPWMIWDYEVIGETADYFVLWKWNADQCNYAPGLIKKSEMPQQMADFNESKRRLEALRKTPEPLPVIERKREGWLSKIRKLFGGK